MSNGCCHSADLAVFPFNQLQSNPGCWHSFSETDRGITWRQIGLRLDQSGFATKCFAALNYNAFLETAKSVVCGNSLYLRPVLSLMCVARLQKELIQFRFVT